MPTTLFPLVRDGLLLVQGEEPGSLIQVLAQLLAFFVLFGLPWLSNRKSSKDKRPNQPKPGRSPAEKSGREIWRELLEQAGEQKTSPKSPTRAPRVEPKATPKPARVPAAPRQAPPKPVPKPPPIPVAGQSRKARPAPLSEGASLGSDRVELPSSHFGEDRAKSRSEPLVEFGRPLASGLSRTPSEESLERGLPDPRGRLGPGGTSLTRRKSTGAYAAHEDRAAFVRPGSPVEWRRALVLGEVLGSPVALRQSGPGDLER